MSHLFLRPPLKKKTSMIGTSSSTSHFSLRPQPSTKKGPRGRGPYQGLNDAVDLGGCGPYRHFQRPIAIAIAIAIDNVTTRSDVDGVAIRAR